MLAKYLGVGAVAGVATYLAAVGLIWLLGSLRFRNFYYITEGHWDEVLIPLIVVVGSMAIGIPMAFWISRRP